MGQHWLLCWLLGLEARLLGVVSFLGCGLYPSVERAVAQRAWAGLRMQGRCGQQGPVLRIAHLLVSSLTSQRHRPLAVSCGEGLLRNFLLCYFDYFHFNYPN